MADLEIGIANWKSNLTKVNPNLSLCQSPPDLEIQRKHCYWKIKHIATHVPYLLGDSTMFCTWLALICFLYVVFVAVVVVVVAVVVRLSC